MMRGTCPLRCICEKRVGDCNWQLLDWLKCCTGRAGEERGKEREWRQQSEQRQQWEQGFWDIRAELQQVWERVTGDRRELTLSIVRCGVSDEPRAREQLWVWCNAGLWYKNARSGVPDLHRSSAGACLLHCVVGGIEVDQFWCRVLV